MEDLGRGGGRGVGVLGTWDGPILFLEENLTCQVIRKHHKNCPPSSSMSLEKIPCLKLEFRGGWGGWLGWVKRTPAKSYSDILLLTLNYTSPIIFIQIRPKLPKFLILGGFWVVGVVGWGGWLGWVKHRPDTFCVPF